MSGMKISVSVSRDDVAFIDQYAVEEQLPSRSAVVQRALRLLRTSGLPRDYADAWEEWASSEHADAWDKSVSDGLPR